MLAQQSKGWLQKHDRNIRENTRMSINSRQKAEKGNKKSHIKIIKYSKIVNVKLGRRKYLFLNMLIALFHSIQFLDIEA